MVNFTDCVTSVIIYVRLKYLHPSFSQCITQNSLGSRPQHVLHFSVCSLNTYLILRSCTKRPLSHRGPIHLRTVWISKQNTWFIQTHKTRNHPYLLQNSRGHMNFHVGIGSQAGLEPFLISRMRWENDVMSESDIWRKGRRFTRAEGQ